MASRSCRQDPVTASKAKLRAGGEAVSEGRGAAHPASLEQAAEEPLEILRRRERSHRTDLPHALVSHETEQHVNGRSRCLRVAEVSGSHCKISPAVKKFREEYRQTAGLFRLIFIVAGYERRDSSDMLAFDPGRRVTRARACRLVGVDECLLLIALPGALQIAVALDIEAGIFDGVVSFWTIC